MRENDSEPDDRRDTPGYVNPWARPRPGDDSGYPPPHYADDYPPSDTVSMGNPPDYQPPDYGPDGYGPPGYGPDGYGPDGYAGFGPPYGPPPRPGHASRLLVYALVAVVAAAIGAGATVAFNHGVTTSSTGVSSRDIPAQHNNAPGTSSARLNQGKVEGKVEPGLVDITATLKYQSETAEGTGMLLSADGLVMTNNHVIDNSTSVQVSLVGSGRSYPAKVIGYDSADDVALLQVEGAADLPTVTFGNSSQVSVGTPVLALGNAEGKGGVTPARGVINALNRSINASDQGSGTTENLHGMQQTSAQIQQGDSGGALANNAGQVIGMITAAHTTSPQPGGTVGFAIPINTALSIVRQIANGAHSANIYIGDPGFLGVIVPTSGSGSPRQQQRDEQKYLEQNTMPGGSIAPSGPSAACIQNDTQVAVPTTIAPAQSGVLIIDILCNTAVSGSGLRAGDVITAVNGHAITAPTALGSYLTRYHPGATVSVTWMDTSGAKHTSTFTLTTGPVH